MGAFQFFISRTELGTDARFEYNRLFAPCFEFETYGRIEISRFLGLSGGLSAGTLGIIGFNEFVRDFNAFTRLQVRPLPALPITVNFNYIHNNIPDYKTAIHSLVPFLSLEWKRLGLSLGTNFRYTSFSDELPIFESIFVFSLSCDIFQGKRVKIGAKYANFDDFLSGNMGSYFLSLYSYIHLSTLISLRNDIELLQTGSVGLASNFYGIRYKGGVVFRW